MHRAVVALVVAVAALAAAAPASAQYGPLQPAYEAVDAQDRCAGTLPAALPSTATSPVVELRVLMLLDGVSREDAGAATRLARDGFAKLGIHLRVAYQDVSLTGDAPA